MNEEIMNMDSNILVSIINMKLRDEFEYLKDYCLYEDISEKRICAKLKEAGYVYNRMENKFMAL